MTGRDDRIEHVGIDETEALTLNEVCRILELRTEVIRDWVAEGVVQPSGRRTGEWRFAPREFERALRARRLQRDLELETQSLPLVLDLLSEVERLRRRLRVLEGRFFE
ncbi:MAG: chaperone modulator CbpM [Wenzhouxiangellaceae bacterium]|nr:chaperone modulator CbpM [Wenzhouxiangellaceae bacterium]